MSAVSRTGTVFVAVELGGILTSFAASLFTLSVHSSRQRSRQYSRYSRRRLYRDKDGEATEYSSARFWKSSPRNDFIICATFGLFAEITRSVFTVVVLYEWSLGQWLQVGAWALIVAQCVILRLERISSQQYFLGLLISVSSSLLLFDVGWRGFHDLSGLVRRDNAGGVLCAFDLAAGMPCALITLLALSLPRRPDVYWKKRLVDRQFTASPLSRYSFSWAPSLLALRKRHAIVNFSDLPAMGHDERAETLASRLRFLQASGYSSLLLLLYRAHRRILLWQWFLTTLQSVAAYGPQFCMYKILRLLESQHTTGNRPSELWLWTVGLGVIRLFQTLLEARLAWLSFATLAISVRSQLSAAIFSKCIRMDLVKDNGNGSCDKDMPSGAKQPTSDEEGQEDESLLPENDRNGIQLDRLSQDGAKEESKNEKSTSGNQDAVNLLSVDAQRISDFCSYNNIFPSVLVTFIIAVMVLVKLIGWVPLLAGLLASLLLMPLNTWGSKHYNRAQMNLMTARDDKVKTMTEALQGIRQIKFSATEDRWQKRIMATREVELKQQWKVFFWALCLRFCWVASPIFLSLAALATYAWQHGSLSASLAFTSLAIFGNLEWCLSVVPLFVAQLLDARVSSTRILRLLNSPDRKDNSEPGQCVEFKDAVVQWPGRSGFNLSINLQFPNGKLSIVHGQSGSGKTMLLSAIIGESDVTSGSISVPKASSTTSSTEWILPHSIAYVAQTPWLENATIKDNILFDLHLQQSRYEDVLKASALHGDLKILPDGDMTEIGARGINLSGGQRWRVSLARAFYSRAGILVLDDIFSAVDAHVGRHIFENGLMGPICQGRTRILATHHTTLCMPKAACIVHLKDGVANVQTDLLKDGPALLDVGKQRSHKVAEADGQGISNIDVLEEVDLEKTGDQVRRPSFDVKKELAVPRKFVEEEYREQGDVRWTIYKTYLRASGGAWLWLPAVVAIAASQLAILARGWWMKVWTASTSKPTTEPISETSPTTLKFFLAVYVIISLAAALLEILKCLLVYIGGLRASQSLFSGLITKVLRARTRWLDTVPLGRILNRFTADFNSVDSRVPAENHALLSAVMSLVCVFIAGLSLSSYMAIPYLVLLAISMYYTIQYVGAAREMRRLDATARSPILDLFGNSMLGLDTIRAFGKTQDYTMRMYARIDDWSQSTWAFWLITQWMSFRMGLMGTLFTVSVAVAIVILKDVDASLAGFVLIFALNYSKGMEDTIKRSANFQFNMNSIERIVEFSEIETEDQEGDDVPASWPAQGGMEIENLQVGYAPDLPPVLHDCSLSIAPRERIGVVGRTGAGKSSLTLALFRCLEARSGRISVDGIDISSIKLKHLRSRMTLIPQDPVLFSGTVRSNLDPFDHFSDGELYESLRRVHLIDAPTANANLLGEKRTGPNVFTNIHSRIHEGGQNLSQGQRQLLCLARATLTKSKIMVLDEATSAVDMATDELIQQSIREQFAESTLIVIAHRLRTVADFDRIVVMAEGGIVEVGSPKELWNRRGAFWSMVSSSRDVVSFEDESGSSDGT